MMFNLRDANYHKELPWNCIFEWEGNLDADKWCKNFLKDNQILKVDIGDESNYLKIIDISDINEIWDLENDEEFDKIFGKYQIYKHIDVDDENFVYNHIQCKEGENWCEETWFARYIVIKSVEWVNSDDNLLKIESHVLYKKWIFKWEKVMETFIWNYEFNE